MKIHFNTPTKISIIDISSMGDSSKRGDSSTIGQFDSGLKYAIALALRDNITISISVFDNSILESKFRFNTKVVQDVSTGKSKELITIIDDNDVETLTSFAKNLGYNWETYMVLRELWSNMLDEGGYISEGQQNICTKKGTIISLEFDEYSEFFNIWKNRHLYINEEKPLFKISDSVEALENKENYLRIYKNNILVYENKDRPSRFAWNIMFGTIDERRILNDVYGVEQSITKYIQQTDNEEFLKYIITPYFEAQENEFLSRNCYYSDFISDTVKKVVYEVYEEFGEVRSYDWLIDKVKKQKDCKIAGKKIKTIEDSIWSYSNEVTIETVPQSYAEPTMIVDDVEYITPFASEIKKYYNFELDVEVKIAKLKGSKVVADNFEKCIIVDESFDIQKDFHTFVVEYLYLTQKGNVVENLSKYICKLISK